MIKNDSVVAIYQTPSDAEAASRELRRSGYAMENLSIVGKQYHTDKPVEDSSDANDRMNSWGGTLFGSEFFRVPGIGLLLMAGPLVNSVVATLEGAVALGGFSALGTGLFGLGVPRDTVPQYETAVKLNKFLLITHETGKEAV